MSHPFRSLQIGTKKNKFQKDERQCGNFTWYYNAEKIKKVMQYQTFRNDVPSHLLYGSKGIRQCNGQLFGVHPQWLQLVVKTFGLSN